MYVDNSVPSSPLAYSGEDEGVKLAKEIKIVSKHGSSRRPSLRRLKK